MPKLRSSTLVFIASTAAIFWPGAFVFAFPGLFGQYWQQTFAVNAGAVGGTVFITLVGGTCFMYLCGRWQEKYGPRRMAAVGAVLGGLGTIWLSRAESMFDVNLWAFVVGAATSFVYLPGLTTVQRWYPKRRGLVSGVFNMVFGLSAAIVSPLIAFFLSKWNYAAVTGTAGAAALIIGLLASAAMRFPDAETTAPQGAISSASSGRSMAATLKSREFWFLWFTWALAGAAGVSMLVLATGFGLNRGLALEQAVILLTAFNLTNGIGRFVSGYLSDGIGRTRTLIVSFTGAGVAYLILPHLAGLWLWAVSVCVIGMAFGAMFAVSGPLAGDCFGMAHFGAVFGLIFTAYGFVAGPLGPWLSGYVLDVTRGNYTLVFSSLGLMYLMATTLILTVRPWRACRV
jgi:MFS transporter, OFA family, oxalate/formate antiporter